MPYSRRFSRRESHTMLETRHKAIRRTYLHVIRILSSEDDLDGARFFNEIGKGSGIGVPFTNC